MPPATPSVKAIFDQALEIDDAAERAAYLDRACAGAPWVRAQRILLQPTLRFAYHLRLP